MWNNFKKAACFLAFLFFSIPFISRVFEKPNETIKEIKNFAEIFIFLLIIGVIFAVVAVIISACKDHIKQEGQKKNENKKKI